MLHCPVALDDHILPDETMEEWHDRFSRKFRQAIPDYPMLAEIWNPRFYVSYGPE